MRVFFCAGEASGDAYAYELARRLPDGFELEGIGGRKLASLVQPLVADSSTWGVIGIAQALRVLPKTLLGFYTARRALARGTPGLFIPIDFGFMNIRLARFAKRIGWKVLYFVPPGSWRRDRQGEDLPQVTDAIVTPFSWSAEILTQMGARAHWFGHPLREMVGPLAPHPRTGLAIFPGSRTSEIDLNLPLLAKALLDYGEILEFSVAPSLNASSLADKWAVVSGRTQDKFTQNDNYGVLKSATAAIICSGTATLEAALCRCPMVVIYRVSKLVELQARLIGFRPQFIALPNILLQREVVKELLQDDATPENLTRHLNSIQTDASAQLAAFEELEGILGPSDALTRTVELILDLAKQS